MKSKNIFFFNGVNGPKNNGNQSLKNTLMGYLKEGYTVFVFDILSKNDPRFCFGFLQKEGNFIHVGAPIFLWKIVKILNQVTKYIFKKSVNYSKPCCVPDSIETIVDPGISEVNRKQIIFAEIYSIFEIFRSFIYIVFYHPNIIYGFEIYGARVASFWKRYRYPGKIILRFMGTYITDKNVNLPPIRYHLSCLSGACDGIVMTNDGTRGDVVLNNVGFPKHRLLFMLNGVDNDINKPCNNDIVGMRNRINPSKRSIVIGIFNRFYPFKRIDRAIRIHKLWKNMGIDAQLVIAGHGGPLEQDLKSLIESLETEDSVTWLPPIPHFQMASLYCACDITLVMNDYANLGNQIIESLFLKVPLLAIDDGENSRLFSDCPYARFIKPCDLVKFSEKDIQLLLNSQKYYSNSLLLSWTDRIKVEIQWVENLST